MSVVLSAENCVRTLSLGAGCALCKEACPNEAIGFEPHLVKIDGNTCKECAACIGVCPTEALSARNESAVAMSVEELFCLVVDKADGEICLEVSKDVGELMQKKLDEANTLLSLFGVINKISLSLVETCKDEPQDSSKRALFRMFTKDGISAAHNSLKTEEEQISSVDYSLLRAKKIPPKRALFLDSLAKLKLQDVDASYPLSFASDKHIDDSCDNCSLCYNLCPSGALETTAMKNAIIFSPYLCLKCKLCEDVCEKQSIVSLPDVPLVVFLDKKKKVLKKFAAKLCPTCGGVFATDGDECARCAKESEDAMELLGL
ncbi:MAG: hypothetical protein AB7D29_10175 [Campylobacterales bacterium]